MVALQCDNSAYKLTQMGFQQPEQQIKKMVGDQQEWVGKNKKYFIYFIHTNTFINVLKYIMSHLSKYIPHF